MGFDILKSMGFVGSLNSSSQHSHLCLSRTGRDSQNQRGAAFRAFIHSDAADVVAAREWMTLVVSAIPSECAAPTRRLWLNQQCADFVTETIPDADGQLLRVRWDRELELGWATRCEKGIEDSLTGR